MNTWEDLSRKELDILCRAGLNERFNVRDNRFDAHLYKALANSGLLRKVSQGKLLITYGLTEQGATLLAGLPDDLQRDWWPLPSDIAAIKARLKGDFKQPQPNK